MGAFCTRLRASLQTNSDCRIADNFETLEEVKAALHENGLETAQLIVGVDFTKSNTWNGKETFGGKCLHEVSDNEPNPYESALTIIAKTLKDFDSDNSIPCYGFGDIATGGTAVFSFNESNERPKGLEPLISRYREIAKCVDFYGPTSFAPLIRQAMLDVYNANMAFHVLLILADGQVSTSCFKDTADAIVQACYFPMAIIMVGIGDGPWEAMRQFDNDLPKRPWDNFQFVQFHKYFNRPGYVGSDRREASFAVNALMEVPRQFKICETRTNETGDTLKSIISNLKKSVTVKPVPDCLFAERMLSQDMNSEGTITKKFADVMLPGDRV